MAVFEKKYEVEIGHIGKSNLLTNHGILSMLENIACFHSHTLGYGINQAANTHVSWVLLHWKVSVFKRVTYGSTLTIKTWARSNNIVFTLRDFEIYDENDDLICIASSKWTLINTETKGIMKISDDIISCYNPEEKSVFNEESITKLKEPVLPKSPSYTFNVQRRDIDFNQHMHNLYYLDYAYEALPQNIYESEESNKFEIMYKSGAKLGSKISCYYLQENNEHFIVMKSLEDNKLHAIIKLY